MRFPLSPVSVFAAIVAVALSACSWFAPYRIDVRQGNYIDETMLTQLKPGMTREQVRFVLGSPLVTDVFREDRWDYVYRFKFGNGDVEQRAITVFFVKDRFDHMEGDIEPYKGEHAETGARVIEVPRLKN